MRLATICLCVPFVSACVSLSDRPTDLQPAVVVATEQTPPRKKPTDVLWDECFDQALTASPGLAPRLAQECCTSSRLDAEVLTWCQRHLSMLKQKGWGGDQDDDRLAAYHRWLREGFHCRYLKDAQKGDLMDVPVSNSEIFIQCRLSEAMGKSVQPKPPATYSPASTSRF